MSSAQSKFHEQFVGSGQPRTRRLRRDGCRKIQKINKPGLDELCLGKRRDDLENRFVREKDCSFRHGVHVAGEAQILKPAQEVRDGSSAPGAATRFHRSKRRIPSRNSRTCSRPAATESCAGSGSLRTKNSKTACRMHSILPICLEHGQLISVGEQRAVIDLHTARSCNSMGFAPSRIISSSAFWLSSGCTFTPRMASRRRNVFEAEKQRILHRVEDAIVGRKPPTKAG